MKSADEIVADKFSELSNIVLIVNTGDVSDFTKTERMIWFIVVIRCEIDANGFHDVFDQALTHDELVELIGYMKELNFPQLAAWFEETLQLYDASGFYDTSGRIAQSYSSVSDEFLNRIELIGEKVIEDDSLWNLDEKLAALLIQENGDN